MDKSKLFSYRIKRIVYIYRIFARNWLYIFLE